MCGENGVTFQLRDSLKGSPPRVRGKQAYPLYSAIIIGITPACAGKTGIQSYGLIKCQDHPRVCGENSCSVPSGRISGGSPPRVRGKPDDIRDQVMERGITPACAGKTSPIPLV